MESGVEAANGLRLHRGRRVKGQRVVVPSAPPERDNGVEGLEVEAILADICRGKVGEQTEMGIDIVLLK